MNNIMDDIKKQIPANEKIVKTYYAFEGDFRVITEDETGHQIRYTTIQNSDGSFKLKAM